ncbi:Uncharacterized protein BM_BM7303 [Brugia malayi]|uniref:BMA-MDT-17 n=1 Tax=Brugia malayi TaxID=6279 RepID=A0A0K0JRT0_BRUMA|nr:Uncharacterized protein BM_BM7303 [Brugia malayi]CRZ24643.1 BMA-MDT-17 [Brugia malayi]VIO99537.1 Uncharacterized protein BM_BM7303 [Brugia malayi]
MFGTGQPTSSTSQPAGVNIAIEACSEWEIQEIGFDGVEKYMRPLDYSDHVAKLARKVDWRKLIGAEATYDNPDALPRDDGEEVEEKEPEEVIIGMEDRKTPEAGPWHIVAKRLHEALQQVNVLVDTISVLKTPYMEALTVADAFEAQHNMQDMIQQSKQFQWVTRRKALGEAIGVLEQAQKFRSKLLTETDPDKAMFFRELEKMRELWRVRKTGNVTYGDLGYKMFGPKYNPKELFDITRRTGTSGGDGGNLSALSESCLQVQVPCDLIRRSTIAVSIEIDNDDPKTLFATAENDLDYMKVDREQAMKVHWSKALQWAQESLLCRDIFKQLCKDAVILKDRITVIRDGVLIASLFDNILLRVELAFHPFEDGPLPSIGDDYLNRALRQLFLSDLCARNIRHQTFVAMPLSALPNTLDLRGPYAMTDEEIESRLRQKRTLLERLLLLSSHFVLTNRVTTSLKRYLLRVTDPQVMWKWLRATPVQSSIIVTASNRNYDYAGKTTFYIRIGAENFYIATKEGQNIECRRDDEMLIYTIDMLICNYMLNTVAMIASKLWQWQVLHANINATDDRAEPSPTVYMCNQSATRAIFMQFHLNEPPTIRVRKCSPNKPASAEQPGEFLVLNYDRLVGSSLCRKIDNLCSMLKS